MSWIVFSPLQSDQWNIFEFREMYLYRACFFVVATTNVQIINTLRFTYTLRPRLRHTAAMEE